MTEGREPTFVVDGRLDERLVEGVLEAVDAGPPDERIRSALEAAIELAEIDPEGTREALLALRGRPVALKRLESCLEMSPERATLALGASMQLFWAELSLPSPDLRGRAAEILRWLEGTW
jgi:hypothetical protein